MWADQNFTGSHVWDNGEHRPGAQKGCPARPQAKQEPKEYPLGRTVRRIRSTKFVRAAEWGGGRVPVEDSCELRTPLADFFSILQ